MIVLVWALVLILSSELLWNGIKLGGKMTKQPTTAPPNNGGDEVERSLELLDRVLSEFDDLENGNVSLEDDGYMSMNGRRLKPEFPPPPEEAQRIISTLLPRVSPSNSSKRNLRRGRLHTSLTLGHESRTELSPISSATQTTIPKTRHARPYGWQANGGGVPPRTLATAVEKHREVRRDEPAFSDDSLEDVPPPPPPPPPVRHGSVAWEVSIGEEAGADPLYTPGSTKVIGRRRRRSTDRSSSGSMSRLRDCEEWPDPPTGTEDGSCSPLSDSSHLDSSTASQDISSGGTYVIRKGRQRQRKPVPIGPEPPPPPTNGEMKRGSSTFDNIKSLLREGLIEGLDDAPPDFPPPTPPGGMVRVVSLPTLDSNSRQAHRFSLEAPKEEDEDIVRRHDIGIQVAEDDSGSDPEHGRSVVLVNGNTDTSSNEALMAELKKEYDTESINNNQQLATESTLSDPWLTAAEVSQVQVIPVVEKEPEVVVLPDEKPPREFKVKVEVLQHEFGPLPPSPVEEDDEYSDVLKPSPAQTPRGVSNEKREPFYRCLEPPASDPLGTKILNKSNSDHHKDGTSSLKTRSMDAGFSRNHRTHHSSSSSSANRREVPSERRTLPTELQGPSRRRTLQKQRGMVTREECGGMQVSCSLPETPIFARGCDIPRTPHRRAPEVPTASRTTPRQLPSSAAAVFRTNSGGVGAGVSLSEAMAGAELLRLAGGPGRGWYPRHRQHPRPASVEHLDRLPPLWDPKPQTLPPNITPKFYRSPRDALRRVTSLLIRRGNSKEKKDALSPTSGFAGESVEGARQKKGFFRSFWKRSRHYSLEQQ